MNNLALKDQIVLAAHPKGVPSLSDFRMEHVRVPPLREGEILVRNRWLSLDPYMRKRLNGEHTYVPAVGLNEVMVGETIAQVVASRSASIQTGTALVVRGGWQTHAVVEGNSSLRRFASTEFPSSIALGVLGMPGFTAYVGVLHIAKLVPGETLVVGAAAGPVGATVAQLAKMQGARVVAIAGGERKRAYVQTLGVDVALDHRDPDFATKLRESSPEGIDVYFENVGGRVFDAVLPLLNDFARIPICGTVSAYNAYGTRLNAPDRLPTFFSLMQRRRISIQGFIQLDHLNLFPRFEQQMGQWLREGKITFREDIVHGLESAPEAFIGLLQGRNFGKLVVKLE